MTVESNPNEGGIAHPDGPAWEVAHAEKPFRDAEIAYREQLSDAARQGLDWVASQEGEKAIAAYEATKNEEDPAVRVLRGKAEATLEVPQFIRELAESPDAKIGTVDAKEWVRRIEWGIREFGREAVDEILGSSIDNKAKQARLATIPGELGFGLQHVAKNWERGASSTERWHGADEGLSGAPYRRGATLAPWGAIIGDIMAGEGMHENVVSLMVRHGRRIGDVIDSKISFYVRARTSFPAVSTGLDKSLERYGWVWDNKQKTYIKL